MQFFSKNRLIYEKFVPGGGEFGKNLGPGVGNLAKKFCPGVPNPHPWGEVEQRIERRIIKSYCVYLSNISVRENQAFTPSRKKLWKLQFFSTPTPPGRFEIPGGGGGFFRKNPHPRGRKFSEFPTPGEILWLKLGHFLAFFRIYVY